MEIRTATQLRERFWRDHPRLSRRRIKDHEGTGEMYTTDTRVAFVDFVDFLQKNGEISERLADTVTLEVTG